MDAAKVKLILDEFKTARTQGSSVSAAIEALAANYDASEAAVRYQLKKHGLVGEKAEDDKQPTDAELGIGEDDGADAESGETDAFVKMMDDPRFKAAIDTVVAARMVELSKGAAAQVSGGDTSVLVVSALRELSTSFERSLQIQAEQQPGYIKPLPREEVERRAAGYVEMTALLKDFERRGTPPAYIIQGDTHGDVFVGPSPNGPTMYQPGMEIECYLPPAERFEPINDEARKVYAAMLQWIGGRTPDIGDMIVAAHAEANGRTMVTTEAPIPSSKVTVREGKMHDVARKHPHAHLLKEGQGTLARPQGVPARPMTARAAAAAEV